MTNISTETPSGFENFGISSQLLQMLGKMKIFSPTPIQNKSIPVAITGKDIMGIAQTGTGKTLAFGIPLVQRLDQIKGKALILLPTRELAHQVDETLQKIGSVFHQKTAVLIGGESMFGQRQDLRRNPRILIATPGRLIDHLENRTVNLADIKILVLDEADRMLDMGFAPQLNLILKTVPKERQTLLFSATMPSSIVKLATTYMSMPLRVEVAPAGSTAADIEQEVFIINQDAKLSLLEKLLQEYQGTVLVFSRTKFGAKKIAHVVKMMGHSAAEIHSNRSQAQRKEALAGFKSGRFRIMVATDIAARGIDVRDIEVVINFDLPDNSEDYVHRIGRTGRAGKKGRAVSFATPQQKHEIRIIEKLIRKTITISRLPELPEARRDPDRKELRGASQGREFNPSSSRSSRPSRPSRPSADSKPSRPSRPTARPASSSSRPSRSSENSSPRNYERSQDRPQRTQERQDRFQERSYDRPRPQQDRNQDRPRSAAPQRPSSPRPSSSARPSNFSRPQSPQAPASAGARPFPPRPTAEQIKEATPPKRTKDRWRNRKNKGMRKF